MEWIEENGFGGALIFTMEYDDFLNKCNCEEFPILSSVNRQFGMLDTPDPKCKFFWQNEAWMSHEDPCAPVFLVALNCVNYYLMVNIKEALLPIKE